MQGATELALLTLAFVGLQLWWLSKVFFESPSTAKTPGQADAS